jgi:predicted XRE-type DNA-binding protein
MSPNADPIPALKSQAVASLADVLRHENGDDLGALLGTDRFRISDLRHGRLTRFSLETPLRFLGRAGMRIELRVERASYRNRSTSRARAPDSHQSPLQEAALRRRVNARERGA